MMKKVTYNELQEAQTTILQWFLEKNAEDLPKPVTMLDAEFIIEGNPVRIISFMTFYGRGESPIKVTQEVKE